MQSGQRDIEEKSLNTQAKSESLQDMKKIRDNGEVDTEKKKIVMMLQKLIVLITSFTTMKILRI